MLSTGAVARVKFWVAKRLPINQEQHHGNQGRHQRWARFERADLLKRYGAVRIQGVSERQAAQVLAVPRSPLQAWRGLYAAGLVIFDVICSRPL